MMTAGMGIIMLSVVLARGNKALLAQFVLGGELLYLAAYPLAAFLLVEAVCHTASRKKLFLRLFLIGLVAEIPMDFGLLGIENWKSWLTVQNYFFVLALGVGVISLVEHLNRKYGDGFLYNMLTLVIYIAAAFLAFALRLDQGSVGILTIVALYLCRGRKLFSLVFVELLYFLNMYSMGIYALVPGLSILLTFLYNGQPGENAKKHRQLLYMLYPMTVCAIHCLLYFV